MLGKDATACKVHSMRLAETRVGLLIAVTSEPPVEGC